MNRRERMINAGILLLISALIIIGAFQLQHEDPSVTLTIGIYSGSYWDAPSGDSYEILERAISRFTGEYPQVKVVTYQSGIEPDDYSEWLAEKILRGEEPDLFFVLPEDFDMLATSGALEKLDHFMDEDGTFDHRQYYEPCLKAGKVAGSQYGLPVESVPTIMCVNKTLLEKCGIPMPENNWTWEDFYSICEKVTDVDKRQFGVYDYTWVNALYSNGAVLFSEDGKKCYLTDEKIRSAIRFEERLGKLSEGYEVSAKDFDLGNVAFRPFLYSEYRAYQPYPWRVKKYMNFEWDGICMPAGPSGDSVSELQTMFLGISSRSRHKRLAWTLAGILSADVKVQKQLYEHSNGVSPLVAVSEDNKILAKLGRDIPGGKGFDQETVHKIMSRAAVIPHFSGYDQAMTMALNAVEKQGSGQQYEENNIYIAQRQINRFLLKQ